MSACGFNEGKPYAVVTMLTNVSDGYIEGIQVLAYSLHKWIANDTDLLLLVKNDLREYLTSEIKIILKRSRWKIKWVGHIRPPKPGFVSRYADQFTKIWLWSLEKYTRIIYLDADMITGESMFYLQAIKCYVLLYTIKRRLGKKRICNQMRLASPF